MIVVTNLNTYLFDDGHNNPSYVLDNASYIFK